MDRLKLYWRAWRTQWVIAAVVAAITLYLLQHTDAVFAAGMAAFLGLLGFLLAAFVAMACDWRY